MAKKSIGNKEHTKKVTMVLPLDVIEILKSEAKKENVSMSLKLTSIVRSQYTVKSPKIVEIEKDLKLFAQKVINVAKRCKTGWFGDKKIFISHVWRAFNQQIEIPIDDFKDLLVKANHQGLITLARADLVDAMDPNDVMESRTNYLNGVFNFIDLYKY